MATLLPDDLLSLPHRRDVPFARLTTLGVGGVCRWLFEPTTEAEAATFVRTCVREGLPWKVLGGGSNLLVLGDIDVPVLRLRLSEGLRREAERLVVPASFGHIRLAEAAAEAGLSGMEYAGGIPGSCGGALVMNAGAHGRELVDVLDTFTYVTLEGETVTRRPEPGDFGYRRSTLRGQALALGFTVRLAQGDPAAIRAHMEAGRSRRKATQPIGTRNAGCIFKNPPGDSAGRLIEAAGLKGLDIGGALVSPIHANFLVNTGQASPEAFWDLVGTVRQRVLDQFGIALEPEVEIWTPGSPLQHPAP